MESVPTIEGAAGALPAPRGCQLRPVQARGLEPGGGLAEGG